MRGHGPAADDVGSYMLFKPAAGTTSSSAGSDYIAMPGVLKSGSVDASDQDRSSKIPLSSRAASFSSSPGSRVSEYMEMAPHAAHGSKVVSEPGSKRVTEAPLKKLSTGSRGGDDYMSMQARKEEGYVDMKNIPSCCGGWLYFFKLLHIIFIYSPWGCEILQSACLCVCLSGGRAKPTATSNCGKGLIKQKLKLIGDMRCG